MSLTQSQTSNPDDVIPCLPRPNSILQKQSSFTRGAKRAAPPSETGSSTTVALNTCVDSKPPQVMSASRVRNNSVNENKSSTVYPPGFPKQDVGMPKKVMSSHPAAPPSKPTPSPAPVRTSPPLTACESEPISAPVRAPATVPARAPATVPARAPATVPASAPGTIPGRAPAAVPARPPEPTAVPTRTPDPTSVPVRAPASIPTRTPDPTSVPVRAPASIPTRTPEPASVPVRAPISTPPLTTAPKVTNDSAIRKVSPPQVPRQRVVSGDSSASTSGFRGKAYEPEGVRRVSDGTTYPLMGVQALACPFTQNASVMRHDSFGPSRFGSFCGGIGSMGPMGFQNPYHGSMYGPMGSAYGSMGPARIPSMGGSFMFRGMDGRMPGYVSDVYPSTYGSFRFSNNVSMYPMQTGSFMGGISDSFYGPRGAGSIMNASLYDNSYINNSFYKTPISGQTSSYGLAAQWSSLADMSGLGRRNEVGTSDYGGFQSGSHYRFDDMYPKCDQDTSVIVKRSGRRGGKNICSETKNENPETKPIKSEINVHSTSLGESKQSESLSVKQKIESSSPPTKVKEVSHKARAAVPTSYDVHTLLIVDKCGSAKPDIVVSDPNTVVLQKNGRDETFECDEALQRDKTSDEIDSVLFSDLRSNWLAGHCSAILCCAGKGKDKDAIGIVHNMVKRSLERLEKTPITTFDVSISMCQLRGANQGLDLFNETNKYENLKLGSHPVYGPCLLGLTTKVVRNAKECVETLDKGIEKAQRMDEITAAFLVLKMVRKSSSSTDVFLSSLCIAYMHETPRHITELKDKASMSPHRLFRYAVGGACVCVSMVVLAENDTNALACLETERKVREVKNKPPRSGNVRRFIEFTDKEIVRQKEKIASSSGTELTQREMQVKRMEDMLEDARAILNDPEHSQVKGYILS